MSVPKVSVLMAVRDGAAYLTEALDSLWAQSFSDFELIVVDDGSQDETPALLAACGDPRLVRLRNVQPLGLAGALNRAIGVARGTYWARQDADDRSLPDRLAEQAAFLDRHPDAVLLGSAYDAIDSTGGPIEVQRQPEDDRAIRWQMLFHNAFCHSSVMTRGAALRQRGLAYDPALGYAQDYDLWSRLLAFGKGANLARPHVALRLHAGSLSGANKTAQQAIATQIAARNIEALLGRRLDIALVADLRAAYYGAPDAADSKSATLMAHYLALGHAFRHHHGGATPPAARDRYWIERFLLTSGHITAELLCQSLLASPWDAMRALAKRLLRGSVRA